MMATPADQQSLPLFGGGVEQAIHRPLYAVDDRVGFVRDASWRGVVVQVALDTASRRCHFWVVWTVGCPGGPFEYTATALHRLPKPSPDTRRTERQGEQLAVGLHPLTAALGYPVHLHPDAPSPADRAAPGPRCGNCHFRRPGRYPKCVADNGRRKTHGPGTDIRAWWPGCDSHQEATG